MKYVKRIIIGVGVFLFIATPYALAIDEWAKDNEQSSLSTEAVFYIPIITEREAELRLEGVMDAFIYPSEKRLEGMSKSDKKANEQEEFEEKERINERNRETGENGEIDEHGNNETKTPTPTPPNHEEKIAWLQGEQGNDDVFSGVLGEPDFIIQVLEAVGEKQVIKRKIALRGCLDEIEVVRDMLTKDNPEMQIKAFPIAEKEEEPTLLSYNSQLQNRVSDEITKLQNKALVLDKEPVSKDNKNGRVVIRDTGKSAPIVTLDKKVMGMKQASLQQRQTQAIRNVQERMPIERRQPQARILPAQRSPLPLRRQPLPSKPQTPRPLLPPR